MDGSGAKARLPSRAQGGQESAACPRRETGSGDDGLVERRAADIEAEVDQAAEDSFVNIDLRVFCEPLQVRRLVDEDHVDFARAQGGELCGSVRDDLED